MQEKPDAKSASMILLSFTAPLNLGQLIPAAF